MDQYEIEEQKNIIRRADNTGTGRAAHAKASGKLLDWAQKLREFAAKKVDNNPDNQVANACLTEAAELEGFVEVHK